MLTRGKIIGDIIDGLSQLTFIMHTRSQLGLLDLNKHCENFTRDLLNLLYSYKLRNLNEERHNVPGLDLGDKEAKVAYQVTADKSSSKINETLSKITEEQKKDYQTIFVFILGTKQKSYEGIDRNLADSFGFTDKNIIDLSDVESKVANLTIDELIKVNDFFSKEFIRVISNFNIDESPTTEQATILRKLESKPEYCFTNCRAIIEYMKTEHDYELDERKLEESCRELIKTLIELPRITREFFYALVSRSSYHHNVDSLAVRMEIITRILNIHAQRLNEELSLLEQCSLVRVKEENEHEHYIVMKGICKEQHILLNIVEFAANKGFDLKKILIDLDFSSLAG